MGWRLLRLGQFDRGGLANNCGIKFTTWYWFVKIFGLHRYRVIKVLSPEIQSIFPEFQYFRIQAMRRAPNLTYEIEAWAYNDDEYEAMEAGNYPGQPISSNPGGDPGALPLPIAFSSVSLTQDQFKIVREYA